MILQALYEYYQRKAADPDSTIAPRGLEWKEIPYLIIIDKDGQFVRLEDTTEGVGKQKRAKRFLVVKGKNRTGSNSWQTANLCWDHFGYVLAHPKNTDTAGEQKAIQDAQKQNSSFVKEIKKVAAFFPKNEDIQAVSSFYDNPGNIEQIKQNLVWEDCKKKDGTNLSFRLDSSDLITAELSDIVSLVTRDAEEELEEEMIEAVCLITGKKGPVALLNSPISIPGGKSGAKLVGFQKKSGYDSYYKEQGMNAPISREAEDAYTTALNTLLGKDSRNKYKLNDTSVVFWAQKETTFEEVLTFSFIQKDDPDREQQVMRNFLKSPFTGVLAEEGQTPFYILGLAPNAARISVRFWRQGTVAQFAGNLKQHFEDLEIVRDKTKREYYSVFNLLTQVSYLYKMDNLPPNLVSDLTQRILDNQPYPTTLQMQCLLRIKADRNISSVRAAILKAYLNRKFRHTINKPKEITMAVDLENKNQAYLCGRLFAILEKIQGDAIPGANSTIKDRYYGAASTTPVTVFGRLLSLSRHHLSKMENGKSVYYEKLLQGVITNLDSNGLPKFLSMDDQSRFAIGYYHEREYLFTKKETANNIEQES